MNHDHAHQDSLFADGRNVLWELEGYGADDRQHSSRLLGREEYLRVRHLFAAELGDDDWMMAGSYPVPPQLWGPLQELLGPLGFEDGQDYFLGARQNLAFGEYGNGN
ncbi:hypothetical protein [Streptomyces sp. CBMA123]|uniref:hypothetical protein n=1 Tax=Streptomyces sp. CBMA123 TaxID=1896313 RepID=UPI001661A628|nr:hypothetical protein [Streptomyces sp. CBMA123]MBD0689599.1 hypothetical protein [Streptomyces sp. CBMA123]